MTASTQELTATDADQAILDEGRDWSARMRAKIRRAEAEANLAIGRLSKGGHAALEMRALNAMGEVGWLARGMVLCSGLVDAWIDEALAGGDEALAEVVLRFAPLSLDRLTALSKTMNSPRLAMVASERLGVRLGGAKAILAVPSLLS